MGAGEEPCGVEFWCWILPRSLCLSLWAAQGHLLQKHLLLLRTLEESLGQSCDKTCRDKAVILLLESQQFSLLVRMKTIAIYTKKTIIVPARLRKFCMFGQNSQEEDDRHTLHLDSRQSEVTSHHNRTVGQGSPAQMQGTT